MSTLPIGAYVAAALEAANIPCDSGEDVDRFLDELAERGYVVVPGPATMFRFTSWDDTALVIAVDDTDPGDMGEPRMLVDYDNGPTTYLSVKAVLHATPGSPAPTKPPPPRRRWISSDAAFRPVMATTSPRTTTSPSHQPPPDPLRRVALANTEAYVRGHWDGLHCDAKGFGGILDECEHVGRIYEPR